MKIKAINGFKDILPDEVHRWQRIEACARDIFQRFGLREIRLPILEKTELFARSIGETTDIVEKEMYTFPDKGITMRPEATASLLRAFIEHSLHLQRPVQRLFTIGPMFRHERPQKGRLRQFHQIDAEIIGAQEPQVDAELMAMGQMLLTELGLTASLEINSLGCPDCRPDFREKLVRYLEEKEEGLCEDCRRRRTTNPLRVLDCKKATCRALVQNAPSILDSLCAPCREHFQAVQKNLDLLGVTYKLNRFMVRGLDYYTRTTFEFIASGLGAQSAVGAGGRYDGLIHQLGGPGLPGIGFAMGMERLVLLMESTDSEQQALDREIDIFAAALGQEAMEFATPLIHALRKLSVRAAMDYSGRSLKAQMKQAGRLNAAYTLIIGEQELAEKKAILRNMDTQEQTSFSLEGDTKELAGILAKTCMETARSES
ncbi:histidine--tRNA ligase [Desulfolithobacter dissulfuricans]|uniref:Histidine--tRNA ligase n=1 Tax=Desulfolithobacter dissulfuricans TaxID=2795293 RepID=A0A915XJI0_9BACT|nr:histidine--tRNA ligase [Desulfolithobacter dissulfuricans]BCO07888.1 histidine--tRNA ligase [Desulfolithobacter dissulfuricans]